MTTPYIRRTLEVEYVTNPHVDPLKFDPVVEIRLTRIKESGNCFRVSTDFGSNDSRTEDAARKKFDHAVNYWTSKKAVHSLQNRPPWARRD